MIDDFHYLENSLQGSVVRALKGLIFEGQPCIILAIPHRRFDAMRVEREMTARIHQVRIPQWLSSELRQVPNAGLPLLNATVDDWLVEMLISEALGSPPPGPRIFLQAMH